MSEVEATEGSQQPAEAEVDTGRVPGWYRDPDAPRFHRYWDGRRWHAQQAYARVRSTGSVGASDPLDIPRPRS
jgi:hypothetical protein